MHPSTPLKLKILITLVGLSAVALPIFLIAIDFNPVGYFYQPTASTEKNAVTTPTSEVTLSPTPPNLALLSLTEFQTMENDTRFLVVNLDSAIKKPKPTYLNMTTSELKALLSEETNVPSLFKTSKVVLVSLDIVSGEELAKKLMEKGLQVSFYLYRD